MTEAHVRTQIITHIPAADWMPLESKLSLRGVPDLNGCCDGNDVWIELKMSTGGRVRITPNQVRWHEQRWKAGGYSLIVIGSGGDLRALQLAIVPGRHARALRTQHWTDVPALTVRAREAPVFWERLAAICFDEGTRAYMRTV